MLKKKILLIIFFALIVIFIFQNTKIVEINFFIWHISMSRSLILIMTFIFGFVTGYLAKKYRKN